MGLKNTSTEFGSFAKWLHWVIAVGIFAMIYLGLEQAGMERGPEKTALRATHSSIGLIVFVLMTVRLVWRLMNEVPGHPDGMPGWQRLSSTLVHWGIYAAVFTQLVSGPATTATGTRGDGLISFFNLFSFSLPLEASEESHSFWEEIHEFSWKIVAILLIVHTLAALYNHFVAKNDVLRRMTIGLK